MYDALVPVVAVIFKAEAAFAVDKCNSVAGLAVPIPTFPLLVAKLAPVVQDSVPVIAAPVEEMFAISLPEL